MKISTIVNQLEELAPISLQESYDNAGLLVGNVEAEVNAALKRNVGLLLRIIQFYFLA
jgi:putative NIF3 family GTP cyclohydrolase 1 type 2